ncbi:unnamed protein product [Thelazia callipaeda]|uniref:protein-disulfide reductase n=1 Tax=Thelazia callipaeda TaxID=103827 RepID=A0A0N5CLZ0_THECL|nr:unnamed protein product [Thelazia callipaeda]
MLSRGTKLNSLRCFAAGAEFLKDVPLTKRNGETVKAHDLKDKAIILYFSAGWCGHCRQFTPKLKTWYDTAAKKENIEIVWISRDREAQHQLDYCKKALPDIPYIPFGDKHISEFLKKYDVKTIPTARLVNSNGEVVEENVRNRIQDEGQINAEKLAREFRNCV